MSETKAKKPEQPTLNEHALDLGAHVLWAMVGASIGMIPLTIAVCATIIIATIMLRCGNVIP